MGELTDRVFREVPGGVELRVWVHPGAARSELAGFHGEALKIRIAAQAREGQANRALLEFLACTLNLPKSRISILRGAKTREKIVFLQGLTVEEVRKKLT